MLRPHRAPSPPSSWRCGVPARLDLVTHVAGGGAPARRPGATRRSPTRGRIRCVLRWDEQWLRLLDVDRSLAGRDVQRCPASGHDRRGRSAVRRQPRACGASPATAPRRIGGRPMTPSWSPGSPTCRRPTSADAVAVARRRRAGSRSAAPAAPPTPTPCSPSTPDRSAASTSDCGGFAAACRPGPGGPTADLTAHAHCAGGPTNARRSPARTGRDPSHRGFWRGSSHP